MIAENNEGMTPFMFACKKGSIRVARFLVESELAKVTECSTQDNGFTALHCACVGAKFEVVSWLVENGALVSINQQDAYGATPLARVFLRSPFSPKSVTAAERDLPVDFAEDSLNDEIVQIVHFLIERGCNDHLQTGEGFSALHWRVGEDRWKPWRQCWREQTALCSANPESALHVACGRGNAEVVSMLLQSGKFDIDARNGMSETPLHCACRCEYAVCNPSFIETVALLLNYGARADETTADGFTALHLASRVGSPETVKIILDKHVDCEVRCKAGNTPLFLACRAGRPDNAVVLILEGKANVNAQNSAGETPLHYASLSGSLLAVEILLRAGAKVDTENAQGRTPAAKAFLLCDWKMLSLLSVWGAEVRNGLYILSSLVGKAICENPRDTIN